MQVTIKHDQQMFWLPASIDAGAATVFQCSEKLVAHERIGGRAECIPLGGINLVDGIDKANLHLLFLKTVYKTSIWRSSLPTRLVALLVDSANERFVNGAQLMGVL